MSIRGWLDTIDKFSARCPQCSRKMRNQVRCRECGNVCCSQNCHSRHFKAAHADLIANQKDLQRQMHQEQKRLASLEAERDRAGRGLHAECPACNAELRIPRKHKGKSINCPHCGVSMQVPDVEVARQPRPKSGVFSALAGLAFLVLACGGCLGALSWIGGRSDGLAEADRQWARGERPEAVRKYKEDFGRAGAKKDEVLRRIVDHEATAGDAVEARRWVERGLDGGQRVAYESEAARALLAAAERDRAEEAARRRAAEELRQKQERERAQADERRRQEDEAKAKAALAAKAKEDEKRRVEGYWSDLKSDDAAKRLAAANGLAALGKRAKASNPDAVRLIVPLMKDSDRGVRRQAFDAVVAITGDAKAAVPVLVEALQDADLGVRAHAAELLASVGADAADAAPALSENLAEPKVRAEAVAALVAIGKPAVPSLAKAMKARAARIGAAQALGKIGPDAGAASPELAALLSDAEIRKEAVAALELIGKAAVPALIKALDESDDEARRSAVVLLGYVGPEAKEAEAKVAGLSRNDPSDKVRDAATLALGRIRRKR
jgi:HEAT repeat protein